MSDHTTMPHGATLTISAGEDRTVRSYLRVECPDCKRKDAEIERLRGALDAERSTMNRYHDDWLTAEADLAEAEALLREWMDDCCPWTQTELWLARRKGE